MEPVTEVKPNGARVFQIYKDLFMGYMIVSALLFLFFGKFLAFFSTMIMLIVNLLWFKYCMKDKKEETNGMGEG